MMLAAFTTGVVFCRRRRALRRASSSEEVRAAEEAHVVAAGSAEDASQQPSLWDDEASVGGLTTTFTTTFTTTLPAYAYAAFGYEPAYEGDLGLAVGDVVLVLDAGEDGWWEGELDGQRGRFPGNYVEMLEADDVSDAEEGPPPLLPSGGGLSLTPAGGVPRAVASVERQPTALDAGGSSATAELQLHSAGPALHADRAAPVKLVDSAYSRDREGAAERRMLASMELANSADDDIDEQGDVICRRRGGHGKGRGKRHGNRHGEEHHENTRLGRHRKKRRSHGNSVGDAVIGTPMTPYTPPPLQWPQDQQWLWKPLPEWYTQEEWQGWQLQQGEWLGWQQQQQQWQQQLETWEAQQREWDAWQRQQDAWQQWEQRQQQQQQQQQQQALRAQQLEPQNESQPWSLQLQSKSQLQELAQPPRPPGPTRTPWQTQASVPTHCGNALSPAPRTVTFTPCMSTPPTRNAPRKAKGAYRTAHRRRKPLNVPGEEGLTC